MHGRAYACCYVACMMASGGELHGLYVQSRENSCEIAPDTNPAAPCYHVSRLTFLRVPRFFISAITFTSHDKIPPIAYTMDDDTEAIAAQIAALQARLARNLARDQAAQTAKEREEAKILVGSTPKKAGPIRTYGSLLPPNMQLTIRQDRMRIYP